MDQVDQPSAPDLDQPPVTTRPAAGVGRLGVISGFFQLSGIWSAIQTVWLTAAMISPPSGSSRPFALVATCGLSTIGFFRTSWLIDRRRRSGVQLAALCFLASGVGYAAGAGSGFIDLAISGVGLGLVASVWGKLERE